MEKINNKNAIILVYVLFLITITVVLSTIMMTSINTLFNISAYESNESKLLENIKNDGNFQVNLDKIYNSNGTGFIDLSSGSGSNISCRNQGGDIFLVEGNDGTKSGSDSLDDNCNSDNYKVTSTGTTSTGIYYPNNFEDDDVFARKTLVGYVKSDDKFKKVFFNTEKYKDIISNNINNDDSLNLKVGDVDEGYLYLDIDKDISLQLLEFDKSIYLNSNELVLLNKIEGDISAGNGFIRKTGSNLNLFFNKMSSFKFDFKNKLYSILIKNRENTVLKYKIKSESDIGTGIYIAPIDDSLEDEIIYLGSEIIIGENNNYIGKEEKVIFNK